MTTTLTETQVIVLDTLRTVVVTAVLRTSVPDHLEASARLALEAQGLTWDDFVAFASK